VATHVDHKIPKAQGGTDDENNLQAICVTCHKCKTERESNEGRGGNARPR
jgi:5-methylcytosine-specific restriction endonuclease McrA